MPKKDQNKTDATPPSGKGFGMTEEDLAALDGYENSEAGKTAAAPEPESRAAGLTKLFYQTPEGKELREMADSVKNGLNEDDTVAVQIHVPRQFIRQTEFLEGKRVTDAGGTPRAADRVLNQILLNELHDQLHWLVASPANFSHYRALWNRFCDAQGAPEEKIPSAESSKEEGPF